MNPNIPDCREAQIKMPDIHLGKCEGKEDCVKVCPYNVFEVRKATAEERSGLNMFEQLKSYAHGHKKAFVTNAEQCHSCGLCVKECPEKAIKLVRYAM